MAGAISTNLSKTKLTIENSFTIVSLNMDPLPFLGGCYFLTKLYLRIDSVFQVIARCEQGLQAVEHANLLSFAGLLLLSCMYQLH